MHIKIDTKHKIILDGFQEQDFPYQCSNGNCREELNVDNIIGFGEYPKGGYRASLKPNSTVGVGFECPHCFTKSCFHGSETEYQMYIDNIKSKKLCGLKNEKRKK